MYSNCTCTLVTQIGSVAVLWRGLSYEYTHVIAKFDHSIDFSLKLNTDKKRACRKKERISSMSVSPSSLPPIQDMPPKGGFPQVR